MKTLPQTVLNTLLVWLLLLAVPFQGFASATMLLCAPMTVQTVDAGMHAMPAGHDHQAMLAAQAGSDDAAGSAATDHHATSKCNSCASCYLGAAMAPAHPAFFAVVPQPCTAQPVEPTFIAMVDLALPERPPQLSLV